MSGILMDIENVVRKVLREELQAINDKKESEWIGTQDAMKIMGCSYIVLWTRATKEKSIRTMKVSSKKPLYFREDCKQRVLDKNYRPPLEK